MFTAKPKRHFLKANRTMTRKDLTAAFNEKFNRSLSVANVAGMCKRNKWHTGRDGRFPKGHVPFAKGTKGVAKPNSGSFKRGHRPKNAVPVGTRVIASGWVKVKVAEPDVWRNESRLVWERHHGEPVPAGMVLLHLDGDFTNNSVENLTLASRAELSAVNQKGFRQMPQEVRPSILAMAKIATAIRRRKERLI